jgi:KUP system potassium uptake protein
VRTHDEHRPLAEVQQARRRGADDRALQRPLADGIIHLIARFGFQDDPHVPAILRQAAALGLGCKIDADHASYFLSRITIVRSKSPGMRAWRKRLFTALARNAASPIEYFGLPSDRTVVMGGHIPC